ncbi:MAG: hypothetical protein KF757_09870 [Phycisphaeraceae bacterium]|nr:hypothetical protein [Phycisphaeraceae bacterium]MCW5763519.1 hypothetical protein [Phycisphaeraceae bacterium]
MYHVVAIRSGGASSPSDPTVVYFGTGASTFTSSASSTTPNLPGLTYAA